MKPKALRRLVATALVFLAASQTPLLADVLIGTNGERLIGRVLEERTSEIVFDSELGGKLTIPRDRIRDLQRTPAAVPASAATSVATNPPAAEATPWFTLPPSGEQFDWIQLKRGEWLKGRLKSMQNHKLEFDSEEFDEQSFDWKDIQRVWAPKFNQVSFEKLGVASGSLFITRDEVHVTGEQTNTYPRSELVSIAPGGRRELDNWSAKLTIGLNIRAGNSKQVDYNAHINIARLTPSSRLALDYLGNYSQLEGVESANNQRISADYDYFLSSRLYLQVPSIEYYHDPLQNLNFRLTIGAGVGYDLISNARTRWTITAGPAYQINQYDSVEAGEESRKTALAAVLGSRIDIELTKRIELLLEYRGQFTSKEVGETTHHSVATLSVDLRRRFDLPARRREVDRQDFRVVVGLGVRF